MNAFVGRVFLVSVALIAACSSDPAAPLETAGDGGAGGDGGQVGDAGAEVGQPSDSSAPEADASVPPMAPLNLNFDNVVRTALHVGSAWYLGGDFTVADAVPAPRAIGLTLTGAPATTCKLDLGFDGTVFSALQVGNALYVGGAFNSYRGQPVSGLVKLDATTCAMDTVFSPPGSMGFNGGNVRSLATAGTSLYAVGEFVSYRNVPFSANRIAKLDLVTGDVDVVFSPPGPLANGFNNPPWGIAASATSLYVAGAFTEYRGVSGSANRLAKLDLTTGAIDTVFSPPGVALNGFNGDAHAVALAGGSVYVGGDFTAYRGVANSSRSIAKLDPSTGAIDTTFSPVGLNNNGFSGSVRAIAATPSALYLGGSFTAYRGVANSALRLAKVDPTTGAIDTMFSPVGANGFVDGYVLGLAVSGNSLFAGGSFTAYRGGAANSSRYIAKLDAASGALDTTFGAPGSARNGLPGGGAVQRLYVSGTTLWALGDFSLYGGKTVNFVAKFDDATGALDTTFSPPSGAGFNGSVYAMAASGGSLYLGGSFTAYRGIASSARLLAKLDLVTGAIDTTFSPVGPTSNGFGSGPIESLAISGTSLYAGGNVSVYRGVPDSARGIAKLDLASGAIDTIFSPPGGQANGFDGAAVAMAIHGSSLYAGGNFNAYRGVPSSANGIAKLDLVSGAIDATFSPPGASSNGFDSDVRALATAGSSLYVGGEFDGYRGVANSATHVAKLDLTTGTLDTTFSPGVANGFDDDVQTLATLGTSLYVGGDFTGYRGGTNNANYLAKLDVVTGALDTVFTPSGPTLPAPIFMVSPFGGVVVVGGQFFGCRSGICGTNAFRVNATTGAPQ